LLLIIGGYIISRGGNNKNRVGFGWDLDLTGRKYTGLDGGFVMFEA